MTVVFLTPAGLDAGCWRLMDQPPGVIVQHEYPGHGARAHEPPVADLDALAAEVLASYQGKCDLVGVSMGGMVALHAALLDSRRVRSLFLACTNAGGRADVMLARASRAERKGVIPLIPETLRRWFTADALAITPPHPGVSYAREALSRLHGNVFAADWRAIAGHDVRALLPNVCAITTVVSGTSDVASPVARGRELAAAIPDAQMHSIDAPHMASLERPDLLHRVLLTHLEHAGGG